MTCCDLAMNELGKVVEQESFELPSSRLRVPLCRLSYCPDSS